jgi:ribosomal protein L11 methyltransferase
VDETAKKPSSSAHHARVRARCGDAERAERAAAEAWEAGAAGIEEIEGPEGMELVIYSESARAPAVRGAVAAVLGERSVAAPEPVPEQDWSEAWKAGLARIEISEGLAIRPTFVEPPAVPARVELVIDPGQAFGTGGHASTVLALRWIDRVAPALGPRPRVLDVGTGTGVLALAAIGLAGARAVAFDVDPLAPAAARDNAVVNAMSGGCHLFVGGIEALGNAAFDLVLANLLKSEMLPLVPALAAHTAPEGFVVLSGLLTRDVPEVCAAFEAAGFGECGSLEERDPQGEAWRAVLMRR